MHANRLAHSNFTYVCVHSIHTYLFNNTNNVAHFCSTVALQAEVQQPDVCLSACEISLREVFVGVPTYHQVSHINKTLLTTEFNWGNVRSVFGCVKSVSGHVLYSSFNNYRYLLI